MKRNNKLIQNIDISSSRELHNITKLNVFVTQKNNPALWPESWKKVQYKAYLRFTQVLLPKPKTHNYNLIDTLLTRESSRSFSKKGISLDNLSDLLYYSAGIKTFIGQKGETKRFYPSAGGRYPLEIYPFVFRVKGLLPGGYHYHVKTHSLENVLDERFAKNIFSCFDQKWIDYSGVIFIITALFDRTENKYGSRGYRHIMTEYGHVAQNMYLMTAALNLGCCSIGGFVDDKINQLLDFDKEDEGVVGVVAIGNILKIR